MEDKKKASAEKKRAAAVDGDGDDSKTFIPNKRLKTDLAHPNTWKDGIRQIWLLMEDAKNPTPDDLLYNANFPLHWTHEFRFTDTDNVFLLHWLADIPKVDETWINAYDAMINNLLTFCDGNKRKLSEVVNKLHPHNKTTALWVAVKQNNYILVEKLAQLSNGFDCMPALNIAAQRGYVESMEAILRSAPPHSIDLQQTTIHMAIQGSLQIGRIGPLECFTLGKYPVFFSNKKARRYLTSLASKQKIDTVFMKVLGQVVDIGSEILHEYINTTKRYCSKFFSSKPGFVPSLLNIVFNYSQLDVDLFG